MFRTSRIRMLLGLLWVGVASLRCSLVIDPVALESEQRGDPCWDSCVRLGFSKSFCQERCASSELLGGDCLSYCSDLLIKRSEQEPFFRQEQSRRSFCGVACGDTSMRRKCWDDCLKERIPPPPSAPPPSADKKSYCENYFCGPALSDVPRPPAP
ncbi:MAG: hypothetical protein H6728_04150 [Myxococcales bacterium]|nr:hypothetical protein [Myxococcales bacterium]